MKIWIKVIFCIGIGALLGFIIPLDNQGAVDLIGFLSLLILRIGRALALPLMFFSVVLAIYQLHEDKLILKGSLLPLGISVLVTAGMTLFGIISVLVINPQRIPWRIEDQAVTAAFSAKDFFLGLFPDNLLSVFTSSDFLLPVYILALIFGLVFAAERANAKPSVVLFDSLSRAFYHVNSYFTEFAALGMIVLCADGILSMRRILGQGIFNGLFLVLIIDVAVAVLILVPALLYFAAGRKNPFRWMYGLIAPALTAFISGDVNYAYGMLTKHLKESLGLRRRANALSGSTAILAGRAGSALVGTISFLLVYRSYSSLGLNPKLIALVFFASILVSLTLSAAPGAGAFTAVTILCGLLSPGYEQGYLILKPVFWPLVASGAFLDIVIAGAISLIVSRKLGMQQDKELRFYI